MSEDLQVGKITQLSDLEEQAPDVWRKLNEQNRYRADLLNALSKLVQLKELLQSNEAPRRTDWSDMYNEHSCNACSATGQTPAVSPHDEDCTWVQIDKLLEGVES